MKLNVTVISVFALLAGAVANGQVPSPAPAIAVPSATDPQPPANPVSLAQAILMRADEAAQCRFAFTQKVVADARVAAAFVRGKAAVESEIRFDPRRPIGSRYTLISATKQQKQIERQLTNEDKKGLPSDLLTLLPEGEFRITALVSKPSQPNATLFSFKPELILARGATPAAAKILAQYEFELEIDFTAERVSKVIMRAPEEGVKSGLAKIKSMTYERDFVLVDGRFTLAERIIQSVTAKALGFSTAASNSRKLLGDFEPICDPAEVARIAAAEAAVKRPN